MPYDERLAERIRKQLGDRRDVVEKKMFGGLAFMLRGHMTCGVVRDELMVRVGPERYDEALTRAHARPMDFTGKPLKGMVYVASAGIRDAKALKRWIDLGVAHTDSLPPKK